MTNNQLTPEKREKLQSIVIKYFPEEKNFDCKLNDDGTELYMYGTLDNGDYNNINHSISEIEELMNGEYIGLTNINGKHTFIYKLKKVID